MVGLRVATADGNTHVLSLPDQIGEWLKLEATPGFQSRVRGLSFLHRGVQHALPVPVAFERVTYRVEVGLDKNGAPASIRGGYQADDVTASVTIYLKGSPPMVRYDLRRTGKLRWRP